MIKPLGASSSIGSLLPISSRRMSLTQAPRISALWGCAHRHRKKLREAGRFQRAVGNTIDPVDGYRAFCGHDPGVDALMRERGFPVAKTEAKPAR